MGADERSPADSSPREGGAVACRGAVWAAGRVRGAANGAAGTAASYTQGEGGEEPTSTTPPNTIPVIQSSAARSSPLPLALLDTLSVCLDLPGLDLEPRSLHHWPQFLTKHQDVAALLPDVAWAPPVHCFTPPG
ncbi:UNVERIFIED_CONTAM: hypothetical protein FKN15_045130 [Acipenser sinensis]